MNIRWMNIYMYMCIFYSGIIVIINNDAIIFKIEENLRGQLDFFPSNTNNSACRLLPFSRSPVCPYHYQSPSLLSRCLLPSPSSSSFLAAHLQLYFSSLLSFITIGITFTSSSLLAVCCRCYSSCWSCCLVAELLMLPVLISVVVDVPYRCHGCCDGGPCCSSRCHHYLLCILITTTCFISAHPCSCYCLSSTLLQPVVVAAAFKLPLPLLSPSPFFPSSLVKTPTPWIHSLSFFFWLEKHHHLFFFLLCGENPYQLTIIGFTYIIATILFSQVSRCQLLPLQLLLVVDISTFSSCCRCCSWRFCLLLLVWSDHLVRTGTGPVAAPFSV